MDTPQFEGFDEGFDYSPNNIDDEIILSEVPLNLMIENIRSQIEDMDDNRKTDFVQAFINQYHYSKENEELDDTENGKENLDDLHDKFISSMEDMIHESLGIGLPNIDDASDEDQEELIHYIYRFFIMKIKKNFTRLILNYIDTNKEELFDAIPKKKDVAYLAYKKKITDEIDLCIITSISKIVDIIFEREWNIDDFFHYMMNGDTNVEADFILDRYETGDINGNFTDHYISMVDMDLRTEIECKVKNKYLKKYSGN